MNQKELEQVQELCEKIAKLNVLISVIKYNAFERDQFPVLLASVDTYKVLKGKHNKSDHYYHITGVKQQLPDKFTISFIKYTKSQDGTHMTRVCQKTEPNGKGMSRALEIIGMGMCTIDEYQRIVNEHFLRNNT